MFKECSLNVPASSGRQTIYLNDLWVRAVVADEHCDAARVEPVGVREAAHVLAMGRHRNLQQARDSCFGIHDTLQDDVIN